jgi:hypothetical protein
MTRGYLKSSPHFFRLIKVSAAMLVLLLLLLAALLPAPLQEPANIARVPNPVKSAWFLLWIQELVSYSKYLINAVLVGAAALVLLPWLAAGEGGSEHAVWLGKGQRVVGVAALAVFAAVLLLTAVGLYFRGENWAFVLPL